MTPICIKSILLSNKTNGDSDVDDLELAMIFACEWLNFAVDNIFWMLVPDGHVKRYIHVVDAGDGKIVKTITNILVTNTYSCHQQYSSSISVNINVVCWKMFLTHKSWVSAWPFFVFKDFVFVIVTYLYWMHPNTLIVYNNTINSV